MISQPWRLSVWDKAKACGETNVPSGVALNRQEISRGILLVFVFYLHALFMFVDHAGGPQAAPIAWFQNRLLAAQVALFFVLAGQSARSIGSRPLRPTLRQSITLLVLAAISHVPAALIVDLSDGGGVTPGKLLRDMIEPVLLGTGYWTSVAWFFVVLAIIRLLAYAFVRSKVWFVTWSLAVAAAAWAGTWLGWTDNFYEWRNLPFALPLFYAGMLLPNGWRPPRWIMVVSIVGLPVTALANSPGAFGWPCFNCDSLFVQQPFVGETGFVPLLVLCLAFGYCLLAYLAAALVGSRLGRFIRQFGRHSLLLLLMHGWLLVTIYPLVIQRLPNHEHWLTYVGFLLVLPPLHWYLFVLLRRPLAACYTFANRISRVIVYVGTTAGRRRHARPADPRSGKGGERASEL